jgi:hypothetical protein
MEWDSPAKQHRAQSDHSSTSFMNFAVRFQGGAKSLALHHRLLRIAPMTLSRPGLMNNQMNKWESYYSRNFTPWVSVLPLAILIRCLILLARLTAPVGMILIQQCFVIDLHVMIGTTAGLAQTMLPARDSI